MGDPGAKREVHWLNAQGMVACSPRDREAAHRAAQGKLLVALNAGGVTCRNCKSVIRSVETRKTKAK